MICNLGVVGSNPTRGSVENAFGKCKFAIGRVPEWPNGADCKSAGFAVGGSNPSAPTKSSVSACRIQESPAEVAQLIEHQPSKLRVASLSLVFRSNQG